MTGFQLLPPLSESEYAALRDDIRELGVLAPINVDESGVILDGHHRAQIAKELGIACPRRVIAGLRNDTSKRTFALTVNTNRRHLTIEQRRHLTEMSLREDPQLTDREHARRVGVSHSTVALARKALEASGQLAQPETRTDARGRQHKVLAPIPPSSGRSTTRNPDAADVPSVQLDSNNGADPEAVSAIADTTDTGTVPATAAMTPPSSAAPPAGPAVFPDAGPAEMDEVDPMESDPLPLPELADPAAKTLLSDDPAVIDEEQARRNSLAFATHLAGLWGAVGADPVAWVASRYRTGTYSGRDFPRVRDVFTAEGLRTLSQRLAAIADHLDSTGGHL